MTAATPTLTARQVGMELSRSRGGPSGMEYPVAVLRETDRRALQTDAQTVRMSTGTLIEHLAAHPEIDLADHQKLQRLVAAGEVYMGDDDTRVILLAQDGALYKSVIKVDQSRRRLYLLSLFRTNEAAANRDVRRVLRRVR